MRAACTKLASPLAEPIRCFLATKRALNRRFDTEEKALHLLDRHLSERGVVFDRRNAMTALGPIVYAFFGRKV